ncbi:MAG: tetratricopeptide repeat protein [Chitinivibrionales bacterium]|nr:tetratricopeptide repeat protein [Chitinivibrionales bacterium]
MKTISAPRIVLPVFFFLSGMCALIYEIIWQRMLYFIFGQSAFATATVLAAFMAGLSLGSLFFGKVADTMKSPKKLYALLEFGIAASALLFPPLLEAIKHLYIYLDRTLELSAFAVIFLKFTLCFSGLVIPAALMGGTFPAAVKFYTRCCGMSGKNIGILYGANTLGAVAGVILAGFYLVAEFGALHATWIAAGFNSLIGSAVLSANLAGILPSVKHQKADHLPPKAPRYELPGEFQRKIALFVAGLSGFCALAGEVAWSRSLAYFMQTSLYSFPAMLAIFLAGTGLGSLIVTLFIDTRIKRSLSAGLIQTGVAIFILFGLFLYPLLGDFVAWITIKEISPWKTLLVTSFAAPAFIMLIPSILMGMTFPLLCRIVAAGYATSGHRTGLVYSINTLGAILGAIAAGFIFIPLVGTTSTTAIISFINLTAGLLLFFSETKKTADKKLVPQIILTGGYCVALFFVITNNRPYWLSSPFYRNLAKGDTITWYKEAPSATVTVRQYAPHPLDNNRYKVIEVNGVNVAGTSPTLRTTQKLQGHLPLLLFKASTGRNANQAFILGLGTGESSHCITLHDIQNLDCCEIVAAETGALKEFKEVNHAILSNKKMTLHTEDARTFLLSTDKTYDIIESDAVHPDIDLATYTKEYFEICRSRLSEEGIFSSWIPLYYLSKNHIRTMIATLHAVFPHVMIWYYPRYNNKHALILGMNKKLSINCKILSQETEQPEIAESLDEIGLDNIHTILSCFITDETVYARENDSLVINDDDRLVLPRLIPMQQTTGNESTVKALDYLRSIEASVLPYCTFSDYGFRKYLQEHLKRRSFSMRAIGEYYKGEYSHAATLYEKILREEPENVHVRYSYREARLYEALSGAKQFLSRGEFDRAKASYQRALTLELASATVHNSLGVCYYRMRRFRQALRHFNRAIQLCSTYAQPHFNKARLFYAASRLKECRQSCRKALSINPYMNDAKILLRKST